MADRNAFYAQSGGVTAVINASACGVLQTARRHSAQIGKVLAGRNGIIGALTEDLIDTSVEPESAMPIGPLNRDAERPFRSAIPRDAGDPIRQHQNRGIPQTVHLRYPYLAVHQGGGAAVANLPSIKRGGRSNYALPGQKTHVKQ